MISGLPRSLFFPLLYRLQSDVAAPTVQEGVEPEPPFFALRNRFVRVGSLRAAGERRAPPRMLRDAFPKVGRSSRARSGLSPGFGTYECEE